MDNKIFPAINMIVGFFWFAMAMLNQGQNIEHTVFRLFLSIFCILCSLTLVICDEINKNK